MNLCISATALITAALLVLGCGGSSTSPSDTASNPRCRRYASAVTGAITMSGSPDAASTTHCTFDRVTATLRCTQTGSGGGGLCLTLTTQTTYASVADFVEEGAVVGRQRAQRWSTSLGGGCAGINFASVYVYDGAKRLVSRTDDVESPPIVSTFGAWDAQGRPTTERQDRATCSGETWTTTYDDVGRRKTSRVSASGTGRSCTPSSLVATIEYDGNGNVMRELITSAGVTTSSQTNSITSTENVCL